MSNQYANLVVQKVKEDVNIDLTDSHQLQELNKNPVLMEKIIIEASDKVFNKLIRHKDLSKLPSFIKSNNFVEANKNKRDQPKFGFPIVHKQHNHKQEFVFELQKQMLQTRLIRAMMQMRFTSPNLYRQINILWKYDIGIDKIFKFKFVLTYLIRYLEEYLLLCEARFQQIS